MVFMDLWIKIAVVVLIAVLVYREILKSASNPSNQPPHPKAKPVF
jgi:hypothetical protein